MPRRFDHYVIVDWSAASQPKQGRDSIWICHRGPHGESYENPATRHLAKLQLAEILAEVAASGERVVLGFDFPFGYPAGFAVRLGLSGPPWRAVWDEIGGLLIDQESNKNDRFELAAEFNRRISNGRFPFWGCPAGFKHEFLGPTHHRRHAEDELAEKRLIDCWMTGAQPCWKLAYTGSVGSQVLTGIPVVRSLRDDARWRDRARIWPFETGLSVPDDAQIVFAEVWPSWWKPCPGYGPPTDKAQVRTVAEIFAERDRFGELTNWFSGDPQLTDAQRRIVETEEAWTLGVTAPRLRRIAVSADVPGDISGAVIPAVPQIAFGSPLRPRERRGQGELAESEAFAGARLIPGSNPGQCLPAPLPRTERDRTDAGGGGLREGTERRAEGGPRAGTYLRDPKTISKRSFALIRVEADLTRYPASLRRLALRLAHTAGDVAILDDLAWSAKAVAAGRAALSKGAPILVDSTMVKVGVSRDRLPARNEVLCFLRDPAVAGLATAQRTTRSAAAVELWRPHLDGAVVAIGNAPTALFRLLEFLAEGAAKPAIILGFPVGFVGAAEAKAALAAFGNGIEFVTLHGRRGGSAIAAAAVNALASRR